MKNIILIFIVHCSLLNLYSQVTQEWVARYNGPRNENDKSQKMALDATGNVYVTGVSPHQLDVDIVTVKYNPNGIQLGTFIINVPGTPDINGDIKVDSAGNVYTVHTADGVIYIMKSGILFPPYNGIGGNSAHAIAVDRFGSVIVVGLTGGIKNEKFLVLKYSSSGVLKWSDIYAPLEQGNIANAVAVDSSGNVYVTGVCNDTTTSEDMCTIKYNPSGTRQWIRKYRGIGDKIEAANSIDIDAAGNVYITGYGTAINGYYDYATVKYNSAGTELWHSTYDGMGHNDDKALVVKADNSGNVYVTGNSYAGSTFNSTNYATVKYNSSGVNQWVQVFPGTLYGFGSPSDLCLDRDGNVYITGRSSGNGGFDYVTIKYNPAGFLLWEERYNGINSSDDEANSIAVDYPGNVYVTGYSYNGNNYDFATVKYSQPTGIQPISSEIPKTFSVSQNYPNPFNPSTKIRFSVPGNVSPLYERGAGGFITLSVYDILGRQVSSLVNENLKPGTYEVDWNASNFPSGVYYYKLTAGNFSETKKMILIK